MALVAGTFAAAQGMIPGSLLPAGLALTGIGLALTMRRRPLWMALGVTLIFFAGGALMWNARHAGPIGDSLAINAARRPVSTIYTLQGRVERPDILLPGGDYQQFILRIDRASVESTDLGLTGGVLVRWSGPSRALFSGDRVQLEGTLELDISRINPGTRSIEDYYRRRDVHTALRLRGHDALERLESGSLLSPTYWASRFRSHVATRLSAVVPDASRPFILTVLLGDRRRITDETYTAFLESGTAHILAVSGVHIGIIFMTISIMLRLVMPKRRRLRIYLTIIAVLLFALIAGARVSSLRAAIMIALYLASELFDREPDTPTALSLAAILFTLHDPDAVLDAGFQLSFLSIASIFVFSPAFHLRMHWLPGVLREALSTTFAVQILAFPVAISLFHVMPLSGLVANLIVIPLLTVVLWLSVLTAGTALVFTPAALLFAHATHPFILAILAIVNGISEFGITYFYLSAPTPAAIAAYAAAAMLLLVTLNAVRHRARWTAALACALVVTVLLWKPFYPESEVTFLDVGHGDAAFIRTPGGGHILIDAGDQNGFLDMGKRVIAPFLWSNHVSRIDALLITHPDRDHIGGVAYLLDHFPVAAVYLGNPHNDSAEEQALLAQCERLGINVHRLTRGDALHVHGARLEVLHPPRDWPDYLPLNDSSLTLRLTWPGLSVLFPGDAEAAAEDAIAALDCTARILKVPHHGSRTSSSRAFIDAVNPDLAIISVGRRVPRSVLSADVVQRYRASGITVLRTDIAGGIRIVTRDGKLVVQTARGNRAYPMRATN